jgi:hypothetical protein
MITYKYGQRNVDELVEPGMKGIYYSVSVRRTGTHLLLAAFA